MKLPSLEALEARIQPPPRPIRRRRIGRGVYAVLLSNSRGIESWAIQRGRKPPQRRRFPSLRAVREYLS